jgi:hypothetical protein
VARWLDKRNGTTHIMHHPFKTLEGVLWVLEKCESSIGLLNECLKAYFIAKSKSSSWREVSWLPCIAYTDDCHWNSEYHTGQCSGGYNELLMFLRCNWSKSNKWRSSRVIGKKALWNFVLPRDVFSTCLFDISVHFTTHLIKEIKLLGHVFFHHMYVYERFNDILKSFIRNPTYP